MQYDDFVTHNIDMYMGKPKSGKTLIAGSYPKPLLYVSVGNDGGGRVLLLKYKDDVDKGLIKVKNLKNDPVVGGKIAKTSCEKLAELLAHLRKNKGDGFKTIVIDTLGALQDDYKQYLEFAKGGKSLSMPEWGEVSKMMLSLRDNMKRFSEEEGVTIVWITHTSEQEVFETSGLSKEVRIVPDVTVKTGVKFMKDASNIFYCCRKTVINPDNTRVVKFLVYVGAHPLMDTGTRDLFLPVGGFVENFTYDRLQELIAQGSLTGSSNVLEAEITANDKENEKEEV